ncbi:APC family permease [Microbacterium sp. SSM24]|uniref:APC family permease n=1 Tax=Microbacterium sp. SSM24 TaxID=2991714 RepID=UPI002227D164|nr:amino acid permease [Microbacterium sp. SSM24]MCW3494355.1 amino acid permease [Microbacterium sp. SSM24]
MSIVREIFRRKPVLPPAPTPGGLTRGIGTFQLAMLGVGATIGTGVFFVMHEAVPLAGPAVIVAFVVAAIAAGLSAVCYAEMASAVPVSGSTYSYAYATLGEVVAIGVAACLVLEYGVSTAAVASGWSGYLGRLVGDLFGWTIPTALTVGPLEGGLINLPSVVLVGLCALLLIRGTRESATVNTVMVIIKIGVLLMFGAIAISAFNADNFADFAPHGAAGVTAAAGTIFFTFIGLDAVSTAGDEVRDPQRSLPRAILIALAVVVAVYLFVAFAAVGAQPWQDFEDPDQQSAGLAVILGDVLGAQWPATVLAAGAVISIFSVTLVTLFGQSRILHAIGRDGLLPRPFARVAPHTHTPVFSTVVAAVVVALLAGFIPLSNLWDLVSMGTLVAFIVVSLAVMVLRRTRPDLPRAFRVPGYPVTPILSILACGYLISGLGWETYAWFAAWVLVVLAFYLLWGRRHSLLASAREGTDAASPTP